MTSGGAPGPADPRTAPRSWLYVPGHRRDRLKKAVESGADAVVVDLEDAVPEKHKRTARLGAVDLLSDRRLTDAGPAIWVRVNVAGSPQWHEDLAALQGAPADGLRLPRSEDPELVRVTASRTGLPLQVLIETARGLAGAHALAVADPAVVGLGLGESDLAADLRVSEDGLDWARGFLVLACRAARLTSPVQSVWTDVADLDGLRASCRRALAHGFFGRSVVHPKQIEVVHEIFTPSAMEIAEAEQILQVADRAREAGENAVLDGRGRFIDPAVVARAHVLLDRVIPDRRTDST